MDMQQQQPETFSLADKVCTAILLALPAGSGLELDDGVSTVNRRLRGEPPATEHNIKVWSGGKGLLVNVFNLDPKSDGPEFTIFRLDDAERADPLFLLLSVEDLVKALGPAFEAVSL